MFIKSSPSLLIWKKLNDFKLNSIIVISFGKVGDKFGNDLSTN